MGGRALTGRGSQLQDTALIPIASVILLRVGFGSINSMFGGLARFQREGDASSARRFLEELPCSRRHERRDPVSADVLCRERDGRPYARGA